MSRRESRDSDPKRQRSRFDRQPPSPKRSRRDGKPEIERAVSKNDLEVRDGANADKKRHQHLRDAAPLEPDTHALSKDTDKKHNGHHETTKHSPSLSEVPRSQSYYQHDDRGSAGRVDRRANAERGWWRGARDQINRRAPDDERSQHRKDEDKSMRRHDKFHENEDSQAAPTRKRPAFREKKIPEDSGQPDRTGTEQQGKESCHEGRDVGSERREERDRRNTWRSERHERLPVGRDRLRNRGERFGDRAGGDRQSYRANYRERFNNGRQGFRGSGLREEKWEHDLFDEANKSPAKKNEEEQIAKLEALLAS